MRPAPRLVSVATLLCTIGLASSAGAQDCAGDCNGGETVAINELIICVNIASGAPLTNCSPCDVNDDGSVAINELIAAVNAALNGCAITPPLVCGDGDQAGDETCDDGNNLGGDGCAANCTRETRRITNLDPARTKASVQLGAIPIALSVTGSQALIGGRPRDVETFGPGGTKLFDVDEIPVVIKAVDVQFNPVRIPGLACGCIRGIALDDEFGPGVSGIGSVGCSEQGLTDIDFLVERDHNTTPGAEGNSGSAEGLPDDPECDDTVNLENGVRSEACLEGVGEKCSEPANEHINAAGRGPACISPAVYTFSGGAAGRGSVLLRNSTAIGLLQDRGRCADNPRLPNGQCEFADYGPDCRPCTADDVEQGDPNVGLTTSGTASVLIHDAANTAGLKLGVGVDCGNQPCLAEATGEPTDCDALENDPNAPLTGALATAFPTIDADMVGDNVTTTKLAAQQPAP